MLIYGLALMTVGTLNEAGVEFTAALRFVPQHFMSLSNLARINASQDYLMRRRRIY